MSSDRERTADRSDRAVEAQLCDDDKIGRDLGRYLSRCGEQSEGYREIERGPFFAPIGGGQVIAGKNETLLCGGCSNCLPR